MTSVMTNAVNEAGLTSTAEQNFEFVSPHSGETLCHVPGEGLTGQNGENYPIRDGVFVFAEESYTENFGSQWNIFNQTQLDSQTGDSQSRDRLLQTLGLEAKDLTNKKVLEIGSGAGRFTEILCKAKAKVCTLDSSSAIFTNARNNFGEATFIQCSLYSIPLKAKQFDIVVCLGVLQHTPSHLETIKSIAKHLKPGGLLVVDVYPWQWYKRLAPYYLIGRPLLSKLPGKYLLSLSKIYVAAWWPFRKILRSNLIRRIATTCSPIAPICYYYKISANKSEHYLREWAVLDTHDFLSPRYDTALTRNALTRLLKKVGLTNVESVDGRTFRTSEGRKCSGFYVGRGKSPPASADADRAARAIGLIISAVATV